MKNNIIFILVLASISLCAQKKWDKDLVVRYRTLDKDQELLNSIVVTSDTLFYEWVDKKKPVKRKFLMNDTLADKLQTTIKKYKAFKFRNAQPTKDSQNIFFSYTRKGKTKLIVFKQPIKAGSKEEKFMQEFLEPILVLVFRQELNNFPR